MSHKTTLLAALFAASTTAKPAADKSKKPFMPGKVELCLNEYAAMDVVEEKNTIVSREMVMSSPDKTANEWGSLPRFDALDQLLGPIEFFRRASRSRYS